METRTLTQLSPSKLTDYMTCPIKFYARYILGIKSPPSAGMLLGRAVHKALELLGRLLRISYRERAAYKGE